MNQFEVYTLYLAMKMHFTQKSYDFFKYNGKVRANPDSFNKRNDRHFFKKISKHKDVRGFLLSNLIVNPNNWIGNFSEEVYKDWLGRNQSLTYRFSSDIKHMDDDFNSNFLVIGQYPKALTLYMEHKICLESLVILVELSKCIQYWNRQMKGDFLWDDYKMLILKYKPFVDFDRDKCKESITKWFGMKKG